MHIAPGFVRIVLEEQAVPIERNSVSDVTTNAEILDIDRCTAALIVLAEEVLRESSAVLNRTHREPPLALMPPGARLFGERRQARFRRALPFRRGPPGVRKPRSSKRFPTSRRGAPGEVVRWLGLSEYGEDKPCEGSTFMPWTRPNF